MDSKKSCGLRQHSLRKTLWQTCVSAGKGKTHPPDERFLGLGALLIKKIWSRPRCIYIIPQTINQKLCIISYFIKGKGRKHFVTQRDMWRQSRLTFTEANLWRREMYDVPPVWRIPKPSFGIFQRQPNDFPILPMYWFKPIRLFLLSKGNASLPLSRSTDVHFADML